MDAAGRGSDEAFVDEWPNAEGPLSDVDSDAEEAERVAAVAGDARSIHRVVYRLYGRAGRRARQRRSAEVRLAIAVHRKAVLRCARFLAAAGADADVRPVPIEAAIDPCVVRSGASVVRRDGEVLLMEAKGVSRGGPSCLGRSCGGTAGGGSPDGDDGVVGAAVVELDARQSNPPRKKQRTIWEFMRASRASPPVPRGVRASGHGVPQPSRSSPRTLPTGHGRGSTAATRETGGIDAADVSRVASWSTSEATTVQLMPQSGRCQLWYCPRLSVSRRHQRHVDAAVVATGRGRCVLQAHSLPRRHRRRACCGGDHHGQERVDGPRLQQ